jgi:hypothetical protein
MLDKRRSMSPHHDLELLLFLHNNKDLWDAADVHQCMKDSAAADDEEKEEASF